MVPWESLLPYKNSPLVSIEDVNIITVKPVISSHSTRRPKFGFQDQLSLNALREHSAILLTFIRLPFVFKIFVMSIFEWPLKTGFTVV